MISGIKEYLILVNPLGCVLAVEPELCLQTPTEQRHFLRVTEPQPGNYRCKLFGWNNVFVISSQRSFANFAGMDLILNLISHSFCFDPFAIGRSWVPKIWVLGCFNHQTSKNSQSLVKFWPNQTREKLPTPSYTESLILSNLPSPKISLGYIVHLNLHCEFLYECSRCEVAMLYCYLECQLCSIFC